MLGGYYPGQSYPAQGYDSNIIVVLFRHGVRLGLRSAGTLKRMATSAARLTIRATGPRLGLKLPWE